MEGMKDVKSRPLEERKPQVRKGGGQGAGGREQGTGPCGPASGCRAEACAPKAQLSLPSSFTSHLVPQMIFFFLTKE